MEQELKRTTVAMRLSKYLATFILNFIYNIVVYYYAHEITSFFCTFFDTFVTFGIKLTLFACIKDQLQVYGKTISSMIHLLKKAMDQMSKAFICRDKLLDLVVRLVNFPLSSVAGLFAFVTVDFAEDDNQ